jgi:hypothetical protein
MGQQHHVQEAYLKSFEDGTGRLWVYPKNGGKPFHRPAGQCAAEENFQSDAMEMLQSRLIETPGIRALRTTGVLSEGQRDSICMWMGLHILRNQKGLTELFRSRDDYEQRFKQELQAELLFSGYFRFAFVCELANDRDYWLTSDNPVTEFTVDEHLVRCCSASPKKMILFSPINDRPTHELGIKALFNAMVWANAHEHVFSHRGDVSIETLRGRAKAFDMVPVLENIGFTLTD